jgi:hypothetical protein
MSPAISYPEEAMSLTIPDTSITHPLDLIIDKHRIAEDQFYRTLRQDGISEAELKSFAVLWTNIVSLLGPAYKALGNENTSLSRSMSYTLWQQFCQGVGVKLIQLNRMDHYNILLPIDRIRVLLSSTAGQSFGLGALYAFESQEPDICSIMLTHLNSRLVLPEPTMQYFTAHAHNLSYQDDVREMIKSFLEPQELMRPVQASSMDSVKAGCEAMCEQMIKLISHVPTLAATFA